MAKRKLLKDQDRRKLVDIPVDEDNLIRHYSLSLADRLEIELRRRNHNRLGFAIQLCLMRYPGRVLGAEETPGDVTLLGNDGKKRVGGNSDQFGCHSIPL